MNPTYSSVNIYPLLCGFHFEKFSVDRNWIPIWQLQRMEPIVNAGCYLFEA